MHRISLGRIAKSDYPSGRRHREFREELKTLGIVAEYVASYVEYPIKDSIAKFPVHCVLFKTEEDYNLYMLIGKRKTKTTFVLALKSDFMKKKLYERRIAEADPY
jgi:hypothetical protein